MPTVKPTIRSPVSHPTSEKGCRVEINIDNGPLTADAVQPCSGGEADGGGRGRGGCTDVEECHRGDGRGDKM